MKKIPFFLTLAAGSLIVLTSFYGYFLLRQRAGLPLGIRKAFQKGQLIQIDKTRIEGKEDLEFVLSRRSAGDTVSVFLKTEDGTIREQTKLIAFYSQAPFPFINLVIGFFLMLIAFVVLTLRPEDLRARLFYWGGLFFSSALIINGGFYCLRDEWISHIPGILFYVFYPLSAAVLLHFSLTFFKPKLGGVVTFVYLPAALYSCLWNYFYLSASLTGSIEMYRKYQVVVFYFRILVVIYIMLSFIALFLGYKRSRLEEEKAQVKWILYGLILGMGPFVFLYQLPRVLLKHPFISEELMGVFFVFIPIAFSFSIVRFNLMNIELVINKSLVYSILTIFTVSLYLISIQAIRGLFVNFISMQPTAVSLIGVLVAAVAFHPARKKIQEFVDRSFFRISYDYQKSIHDFNAKAHQMVGQDQLVDLFSVTVKNTIPLEHLSIGFFLFGEKGKEMLLERGSAGGLEDLSYQALNVNQVLTSRKSVTTELGMDFSAEDLIKEKNLEMIIPLPFRTAALSGLLTLGKKKSGSKYNREDIELLLTLAETLALNLERIHLQEEVINERAQKEKFDELSRLKTEFISNVSHEIRTPLSSIYGLSEILQQKKIKGRKKQDELLSLMADECGRLSRFLHNILDQAKIEQEAMIYRFRKQDIVSVVRDILTMNEDRIQSLGFCLTRQLPNKTLWLSIDQDAVKQALTNLLDNAIKYSTVNKEIGIKLVEESQRIEIHVHDKGIGIPASEQNKIFKGFYRAENAQQVDPKGLGIGLKIVKHIMEAHGGEIRVESKKNKGSTFILVFPKP
jgi:signal transduction histidine kinase